jgi:hypothetical protein
LKKWILAIISFVVLFCLITVILFEFVFRFMTADFVINAMDRLEFLGIHASLETLTVILVFISFVCSFIMSLLVFVKYKKVHR